MKKRRFKKSPIDIHHTFADDQAHRSEPTGSYLAALSFAALGVVYGDIGTSPLYAIRECFHGPHSVAPSAQNVLGVLSLIFWSLIIVISIKYLVFVLRADNKGEGGILALSALASPFTPSGTGERWKIIALGIMGAALLYGDGILTPAISVLSAMEGITVAAPGLTPFIVPATIGIIVGLFFIQQKGTAKIGRLFGPITSVWFAVLAVMGISQIVHFPSVLLAVNPYYAIHFFIENGGRGFVILGSVFLVVTGGEALYADMGHFGAKPIRIAWFAVVLPSLLLNYFGQGALLLENPHEAVNPFYHLAPDWALFPLILLAASAAVIASQAVISGAFSLTMQAIQLGLLPRFRIQHTSDKEYGQIYLPAINWALMIGCILVVLSFRSSSRLASAYGIAVTSTMVITTVIFYVVARDQWGWNKWLTLLLCALFMVIDAAFFGANVIKLFDGGWLPLSMGAAIYLGMSTWKKGRRVIQKHIQEDTELLEEFLEKVRASDIHRVNGTAIFMNGNATRTPVALLHNLMHNKVLHQNVVFVTVKTRPIPYVQRRERYGIQVMPEGFARVKIYFGFMEEPDVPKILKTVKGLGFRIDPSDSTYFLGRETIISTSKPSGMHQWREKLFAFMSRNARSATSYFKIPPNRVVELGEQLEI
ncbi:MAG: potassium transporter Kup [Pyrinomonadaceae bacterium]